MVTGQKTAAMLHFLAIKFKEWGYRIKANYCRFQTDYA